MFNHFIITKTWMKSIKCTVVMSSYQHIYLYINLVLYLFISLCNNIFGKEYGRHVTKNRHNSRTVDSTRVCGQPEKECPSSLQREN